MSKCVHPDVDGNKVGQGDQLDIARAISQLKRAEVYLLRVAGHTDHFLAKGDCRRVAREIHSLASIVDRWTEKQI